MENGKEKGILGLCCEVLMFGPRASCRRAAKINVATCGTAFRVGPKNPASVNAGKN